MARKKKKQSRKQQIKQQRRAATMRKRKERARKPLPAEANRPPSEILEDMLPLFPRLGDTKASPAASAEQIMLTILASEDLIQEPEFEEILVDPIRCVDTFVEVGQELGTTPEALSQLPDEERQEVQMKILELTTRRLLTDQLRQDILDALDKLRLRLKRAGRRKQVAKVAALESFLRESEDSQAWSMIGLVQAIVQRSLAVGFELLEGSMEVLEAGHLEEGDTPLTLSERLSRSGLARKTNALLRKVPGLSGFLQKQADSIWEEGVEAVFKGNLHFGLFASKELEAGLESLKIALGDDLSQETAPRDIPALELTEEKLGALISQIDQYITKLLTSERLDQLRKRLHLVLDNKDFPQKWLAFTMMAVEYMADEDAVENEKRFLISAFLGEMKAYGAASQPDMVFPTD